MTTPLTTLPNAKEWLMIDATNNNHDALISRLITSASAFIESWCGVTFGQATYTETYNGTGTDRLTLRQNNVTAVVSVMVGGVAVPVAPNAQGYGFGFDDHQLYMMGGSAAYGYRGSGYNVFPMDNQNVVVTYTAGYVVPAGIPADLEQACLELIAYKFNERKHTGKSVEALAGQPVSYITDGITKQVLAGITNYVKVTY